MIFLYLQAPISIANFFYICFSNYTALPTHLCKETNFINNMCTEIVKNIMAARLIS